MKDFKDFATSVVNHHQFEEYFKEEEDSIMNLWKIAESAEEREKLHVRIKELNAFKTKLKNISEEINDD